MRNGFPGRILIFGAVAALVAGIPGPTAKASQGAFRPSIVTVHPRGAALAGATTALVGASEAIFYNPASLAFMDHSLDVSLVQNNWIADILRHQASVAFRPARGRYGTWGLTFRNVDYGDSFGTVRADNDSGFIDLGTIGLWERSFGLGYAHALTRFISLGGQVKYLANNLIRNDEGLPEQEIRDVVAFDMGFIYRTGYRSLLFALTWRNYSRRPDDFALQPVFEFGVSMDLFDLIETAGDIHSLVVALDLAYPREFANERQAGAEYTFMKTVFLRAGYRRPTDKRERNLGAGLRLTLGGVGVQLDYAYGQLGIFGAVNQFAIQLYY